jgi:large subunit ribosomal protein L17
MRHRVKGRKLGRTSSHRLATLRALATSLIKHKKIKTTSAKAKELRTFVEPLITKAKTDSVHSRRVVSAQIKDREVLTELFGEIISKIGERAGGYTRVVKLGQRKGDGAELSIIELVDFSGIIKPKAAKKAKAEKPDSDTDTEETKEEKPAKKAAAKPKKEKVATPKVKKEKAQSKPKKTTSKASMPRKTEK